MAKAKTTGRAAARAEAKADRAARRTSARERREGGSSAGEGSDSGDSGGEGDVRKTEPGTNAAGLKVDGNEAEEVTQNSAKAANEIATRRKEPGAEDPENDGPNVGRVDNRADTSAETQQIVRPARPLTPVNAVSAPLATGEKNDGSLPSTERFAKVRALRMGYFDNKRVRAGDVIWIHKADDFSPDWMEYAGSNEPEKITTGNEDLRKQHQEVMEAKAGDRMVDVEHVVKGRGTGSADPLGAERASDRGAAGRGER